MDDSDTDREPIHSNTIENWTALGTCISRLLFVNQSNNLSLLAESHGWMIVKIPRMLYGEHLAVLSIFVELYYNNIIVQYL